MSWEPPPEVRLVREYKGPTVDGILGMSDSDADRMNGTVRSVLDALHSGRVEAADALLDGALAKIHSGPGHQRRLKLHLIRALVIAALGFAVTCALLWWLAPGTVL